MENKERAKFFKHNKIIAIDPGNNGGITIYSVEDKRVIESIKMPATPQELLNLLKIYSFNSVCYLEKVQGLPGMSGGGMFTFGRGYGHLEMALLCCKIPTMSVTPQKWQKELQLGNRGNKSTTEWKNKLKAKAEQLFPYMKITLAVSDSLLILQYAKMKEKL